MMKDIIKLGITLMVVTLAATIALAIVNEFTEDKIVEQQDAQLLFALSEVVPDADDFQERDGYFEALKDGKVIGKVLRIESSGYSSIIEILAGVDEDNLIQGVAIVNQLETPGLGANIELPDFLEQYKGKSVNELYLKKDGGEIDGITGATISSRAVTDGIREKLE